MWIDRTQFYGYKLLAKVNNTCKANTLLINENTNLGAELPRRSGVLNGTRRTLAEFDPSGGSPKPYTDVHIIVSHKLINLTKK